MSRPDRAFSAGLVVLMVAMAALLFGGGQVAACLGPLGVTAVQCAKATGVVPSVGIGAPIVVLTIAIAVFVVAPVPAGRRLFALAGGVLGGAIGAAALVALRPLRMEGLDSTGAWLSIPLPLDVYALVTAVVVGALLGAVVVRAYATGRARLRRS